MCGNAHCFFFYTGMRFCELCAHVLVFSEVFRWYNMDIILEVSLCAASSDITE